MKITGLEATPFQMTRRDKEWRTSAYAASTVDAFVVKLHTDEGITGLGASTIMRVSGETPAGVQAVLKDVYGPVLQGKDPFAIEPLMAALSKVARGPYPARCGIDLALHDLKGKALGVPVYQLLGGAFRKEVPVIRMVGIKEPLAQAKSAAEMVAQGYRYLKLKIGTDPAKDVQRVAEVRRAVGDDVTLTFDANGAYDVKTAIRVIRQLEQLNVALGEEPCPYDDLEAIATVTRAVDMPIMGDQSITTPADAIAIIRRGAADVMSIKVMKVGGLLAAQKMRAVCEAAAMPYHLGSTATTRLIEAASIHYAVACPAITCACEIGEFEGLDGDVVSGLRVKDGMLRVPEEPGLGVQVSV